MNDRRITPDRRHTGIESAAYGDAHNRRFRPDRRLNSITAEWIPMEDIMIHPAKRVVVNKR